MPLYEYQCPLCGEKLAEVRKIDNRDVSPPRCSRDRTEMKRIPSMPSGKFPGADSWR